MRKLVWIRADWDAPWDSKVPFVKAAIESGADAVVLTPEDVKRALDIGSILVVSYKESPGIGVVLVKVESPGDLERVKRLASSGKKTAALIEVKDKQTELGAAELGKIVDFLIVTARDWKIIPLENLIAELQKAPGKLIATVRDSQEAVLAAQTLEVGTDGVLLDARESRVEEIKKTCDAFEELSREKLQLTSGKIVGIKQVGMGDRACVDTTSMLEVGEGMLVGSQAEGLFLIHSETLPSEFVEPRPFRVNAGGVHSYIRVPDGKTRYLSELKAGDEVLAVNKDGKSRTAVVGRVKIERRPLTLVEAEAEGKVFKILLQNAETINLVGKNGDPIPVTKLKKGDEVLLYVEIGGRHFGKRVEEMLVER